MTTEKNEKKIYHFDERSILYRVFSQRRFIGMKEVVNQNNEHETF